jgi:hypothetical protein
MDTTSLRDGTFFMFDDWACIGHPHRGELRTSREFNSKTEFVGLVVSCSKDKFTTIRQGATYKQCLAFGPEGKTAL